MNKVQVLDHGYVGLVEAWGSDERIIEAARMSTAKGFLGWKAESTWRCEQCGYTWVQPHNDPARIVEHQPVQVTKHVMMPGPNDPAPVRPELHRMTYVEWHSGDERLLRYLWEHKHLTPFEMAGMTIEVQAPIFVFREWHRHRTLSAALDDDIGIDAYNELSARYAPLPDVNYIPSVERCMADGGKNKQAQGVTVIKTPSTVDMWNEDLEEFYTLAEALYQRGLKEGIPKELARLCIPVGRYSRMRASANLRNWLAFLALRMDEAAQWEIRQYANAVGGIIAEKFPRTWQLFNVKGPVIR